jgi:hypothetical protein
MRDFTGYNKNHENRQEHDFYATPSREVENILQYEKLYGTILDNCCGQGHLIEPVRQKYKKHEIITTDLIDRGYGQGGLDFLSPDYPYTKNIDTIIMNPPFKLITGFVNKSLKIARKKIVLLAQIQFLESKTRYENIFKNNEPQRFYIYSDRIACAKNGNFDNKLSSGMCFCWFIWDKVNNKKDFRWIQRNKKNKRGD